MPTSDGRSNGDLSPEELASQVRFLEAEVADLRRRLSDAPARLPWARAAARRRPALARRRHLAERAPRPDPARGPRPDHEAQGGGRPARAAAGRLRHLPDPQRRRLGRRVHRRPQAAGQRQPVGRPRLACSRGQEVMLNEALNVVAAFDFEEVGEVVMFKELLADGERALVIASADEERVVRLAEPLRNETIRAGDSLLLDSRAGYVYEKVPKSEVEELVLEEVPDIAYESIGGLSGQIEQIRDAVELPYLHPELFKEHQLKPPEGRAALRPARLRQDADRQGGRQLAGQEGQREDRAGREVLLPQHQGPRAAQQVRRRDRAAHPAGVPAGPREGQQGHAGHRLLRRDGLAVPHPRVRRVLRRREHHRPAAAERDRRRRAARERAGHRRLQPRGHDRPGDPAARPSRREDQDRAPRRRVGARHLQQVPPQTRCRCTRRTSPSSAATGTPASPG